MFAIMIFPVAYMLSGEYEKVGYIKSNYNYDMKGGFAKSTET